MNYGKVLSWTMVALSIGAALSYFKAGNYKMTCYWIGSAIIITSVTI